MTLEDLLDQLIHYNRHNHHDWNCEIACITAAIAERDELRLGCCCRFDDDPAVNAPTTECAYHVEIREERDELRQYVRKERAHF